MPTNEGRSNKRPFQSDLRNNGRIEADADIILFYYRNITTTRLLPRVG